MNEHGNTAVSYRLLGPGTFDENAKDWRTGFAIERVESTVLGTFATREEAREFMLQTTASRRMEARS